jgi:hypothetical protein
MWRVIVKTLAYATPLRMRLRLHNMAYSGKELKAGRWKNYLLKPSTCGEAHVGTEALLKPCTL